MALEPDARSRFFRLASLLPQGTGAPGTVGGHGFSAKCAFLPNRLLELHGPKAGRRGKNDTSARAMAFFVGVQTNKLPVPADVHLGALDCFKFASAPSRRSGKASAIATVSSPAHSSAWTA